MRKLVIGTAGLVLAAGLAGGVAASASAAPTKPAAKISGYEVDLCDATSTSGSCPNGGSYTTVGSTLPDSSLTSFQLICPAGKVAVSGGFSLGSVSEAGYVIQSYPFTSDGDGWQLTLNGPAGAPTGTTAYVACANVK
jgi:hypothetical protein